MDTIPRTKVLVIFTFAIWISCVMATSNVYACWCGVDPEDDRTEVMLRQTISRDVESSDFVFSGRMIRENDGKIIFEADDVWKGDFRGRITFSYYYNSEFFDSCEYHFEVNKSYLVYANATMQGLRVNKCGRTSLQANAKRDIDELNRQK